MNKFSVTVAPNPPILETDDFDEAWLKALEVGGDMLDQRSGEFYVDEGEPHGFRERNKMLARKYDTIVPVA